MKIMNFRSIPLCIGATICLVAVILAIRLGSGDILNGLSHESSLGMFELQTAFTMWCLAPGAISALEKKEGLVENGHLPENDYDKGSLYALLYSVYPKVGLVPNPLNHGQLYEFTFNTWGLSNIDDYPHGPEEPQRHGKSAYYNLVTSFDRVKNYINEQPSNSVQILEVGCGTGAGANYLSGEVLNGIKTYNALDMQAGAIKKCRTFAENNTRLNCVHGNGKNLPFEDGSIDIVVISETHIAETKIGNEEKQIFAEIKRVMKSRGFFVWGNAIPTEVWGPAKSYLGTIGFDNNCGEFNHTVRAIQARDEDKERVNVWVEQFLNTFMIFKYHTQCRHVSERLIKNFFRHPGTNLYNGMVTGQDSYMHLCFELMK